MNKNDKAHDRAYQKLKYEIKTGKRENMIDTIYQAEWTADIKPQQLKKAYKGKIETDEQKLLFNNALVMVNLIQTSKACLEAEGVYIKTATGLIKENPAQKALRDNIKTFTMLIDILNKSIDGSKKDDLNLEEWLEG